MDCPPPPPPEFWDGVLQAVSKRVNNETVIPQPAHRGGADLLRHMRRCVKPGEGRLVTTDDGRHELVYRYYNLNVYGPGPVDEVDEDTWADAWARGYFIARAKEERDMITILTKCEFARQKIPAAMQRDMPDITFGSTPWKLKIAGPWRDVVARRWLRLPDETPYERPEFVQQAADPAAETEPDPAAETEPDPEPDPVTPLTVRFPGLPDFIIQRLVLDLYRNWASPEGLHRNLTGCCKYLPELVPRLHVLRQLHNDVRDRKIPEPTGDVMTWMDIKSYFINLRKQHDDREAAEFDRETVDEAALDAFWAGVVDARGTQFSDYLRLYAPQWSHGKDVLRAMHQRYGGSLSGDAGCLMLEGRCTDNPVVKRLAPHRRGATNPKAWSCGFMAGSSAIRASPRTLIATGPDSLLDSLVDANIAITRTSIGKSVVASASTVARWIPTASEDRVTLSPEVRAEIVDIRTNPVLGALPSNVIAAIATRCLKVQVTGAQVVSVLGTACVETSAQASTGSQTGGQTDT